MGLRCCMWVFSSCGEQELFFIVVHGLLIAVASLVVALSVRASVVAAHGLSSFGSRALECRLSSCGARAQLLYGMQDPPGPGLELVSPVLVGGFLTTAPPGKSTLFVSWNMFILVPGTTCYQGFQSYFLTFPSLLLCRFNLLLLVSSKHFPLFILCFFYWLGPLGQMLSW